MFYYQHHIGDFDLATRHLSRLERSIYRDLIEVYYDTETQLTLDEQALCRRIIARSTEEVAAVQQVLNEFFVKTPDGWYHDRCEEELDKYRTSNSQKSAAGKASAAKRALKRQQALNGNSTGVERMCNGSATNHKPITNNHKPITKDKGNARGSRLPADWKPSEKEIEFCQTERPDLDFKNVADQFRDYWHGVAGAKGCKLDWSATWRNWVRGQKQGRIKPAGNGAMSAVGQRTWENGQAWLESGNG